MKTGRQDTDWARAWMPPLVTMMADAMASMADAQFAEPPADRCEEAPAAWPLTEPSVVMAVSAADATTARQRGGALVALLRRCVGDRQVRQQRGT